MNKKVKISDLIFYEKNAKSHPQHQIDKIKKSIETFGFRGGVKITIDNIIIVGHGRIEALKQLGIEEVEVEIIEDLSKEEIIAYRIADNKTAESDWINDLLIEDFELLKNAVDFDIECTGYSTVEIDDILSGISTEDVITEQTDLSDEIQSVYNIVITCDTEEHMESSYNEFIKQGYLCRISIL